MRQIVLISVFFLVLLLATLGCLLIFEVLSFEAARSSAIRFGSAIVLLGACSALLTLLMRRGNRPGD
jgi:hypothetical protein